MGASIAVPQSGVARLGATVQTLSTRALEIGNTPIGDFFTRNRNASESATDTQSAGSDRTYDSTKSEILGYTNTLLKPALMAAKFEDSMAKFAMTTEVSGKELDKFEDIARNIGATTKWSAGQAVEALEVLADKKFDSSESELAIKQVRDLATVGDIDLKTSATLSTDVLSEFKLKEKELGRVGDVLTNAFIGKEVGIKRLGQSLKAVGGAANSAGISLEKTAAMATHLAGANVDAKTADASMKSVYGFMSDPSSVDEATLKELNISKSDAPDAAMKKFKAKLDGMSSKQEQEALIKKMFGKQADASSIKLVVDASSDGTVDKLAEDIGKVGTTSEAARKRNETAHAAIGRMQGALEAIALTLGTVLLPPLASVVETVTSVVLWIDSMAREHSLITSIVVGTAAAFYIGKSAMAAYAFMSGVLTKGVTLTSFAFKGLGAAMKATGIGLVIGGLMLVMVNWDAILSFGKKVMGKVTGLFNFEKILEKVRAWASLPIGEMILSAFSLLKYANPFGPLIFAVESFFPTIKEDIGKLASDFAKEFVLLGESAKRTFVEMGENAREFFNPLFELWDKFIESFNRFKGIFNLDISKTIGEVSGKVEAFTNTVSQWWGGDKDNDQCECTHLETVTNQKNVADFAQFKSKKTASDVSALDRSNRLATQSQGNLALALAPQQAARTAPNQVQNNSFDIQVNQQPGQDSAELVDTLMEEIKHRQESEQRGYLYDGISGN